MMYTTSVNIPSILFMVLYGSDSPTLSLSLVLHSDVCFIGAQMAAPTQGSVLGYEDNANSLKVTSDSVVPALLAAHSTPLPETVQDKGEEPGVPCQNSEVQCSQPKGSELPWSNVDLAEMKVPLASAAEKSVAVYPMELGETIKQEERPLWAWITAGQCEIESNTNVSWLEIPGT